MDIYIPQQCYANMAIIHGKDTKLEIVLLG